MSSHWEAGSYVGSSWMLRPSQIKPCLLNFLCIPMYSLKASFFSLLPPLSLLALSNDPVIWEKPVILAFPEKV